MKKHTISIIGFAIQCLGIGLMLYGINNSSTVLWIGFPLLFVGMALVIIGSISNREKK